MHSFKDFFDIFEDMILSCSKYIFLILKNILFFKVVRITLGQSQILKSFTSFTTLYLKDFKYSNQA